MPDTTAVVQQQLQQREVEAADAERQRIRQAASDYLVQWGLGPDLPTGVPGDTGQCVFAHALGGTWNGKEWVLGEHRAKVLAGCWEGNADDGFILNLPAEVKDFIARFDNGEYPDLIESAV